MLKENNYFMLLLNTVLILVHQRLHGFIICCHAVFYFQVSDYLPYFVYTIWIKRGRYENIHREI